VRRSGTYALPGWCGRLRVQRAQHGGVPLAWLAHLELRPRAGGERFQAGLGRPARSLKKQYQAAAVAQWLRDGPLLYSGGQLVFVPGLGIDARVLALPGQAQVSLEWLRAAPV
jgi:tRNA(Ile)-lysidine synthase